jgi:hypothetical protein
MRICYPLHPEELLVWQCAERAKVPDVFIAHIICSGSSGTALSHR